MEEKRERGEKSERERRKEKEDTSFFPATICDM